MCKCVRDADRLDSLKPHYTENDINLNDVKFKEGAVNLSCTRFKTRMRKSRSQVRPVLHITFDWRAWSGLTGTFSTITARPVQDRSRCNQRTCEES